MNAISAATTSYLPPASAGNFLTLNAPAMLSDFVAYVDAKPATLATYVKGIRAFIGYCAERAIAAPEREDVMEWRDSLRETHKPTTIQTYLAGLRRFFSWTAMKGLWANITDGVKGLKVGKQFKKDCLTRAQARELLDSIERDTVKGKRDYAMIALMLSTGVRDVEVARANIGDVRNLADDTALYVHGKGRDGRDECVKLAAPVERAIRDWLAAREVEDEAEPLFCGLSNHGGGERLTTRSVSRIVKGRMQAIGLNSDRLTAHSLRHTAATQGILNGASLEEVRQMMRHTSINTTMIYNHAIERERNDCENRIAGALFS